MSQITIKNAETNNLIYKVYYGGKRLKKNKSFEFKDNDFLIIKQKTIYSNLAFIIFLWLIAIIVFLCDLLSNGINRNDNIIKGYQKLQIFYNKATKSEVTVFIGKSYIEVAGLEVNSVIANSNKCKKVLSDRQNEFEKWVI